MRCTRCDAELSAHARFCGGCGEAVSLPAERPEALASYREALTTLAAGGALPDWAARELAALRDELGIHSETHDRLLAELSPSPSPAAPPTVTLDLDATSVRNFVAGAHCLLRLRVGNDGHRALKGVRVECSSTAFAAPVERTSRALGPGLTEDLTIAFEPARAGQHQLHMLVTSIDMHDAELTLRASSESFTVARGDGAPSTVVTQIDASSMRVGTFDNLQINAAAPAGGLLAEHAFRRLALTAVAGAAAVARARHELGFSAGRGSPRAAQGSRKGPSGDAGRRKVDVWNELVDVQGKIAQAGSRKTPEIAALHHRAAALHEQLGNKEQALAAYEKAKQIDPSLPRPSADTRKR